MIEIKLTYDFKCFRGHYSIFKPTNSKGVKDKCLVYHILTLLLAWIYEIL